MENLRDILKGIIVSFVILFCLLIVFAAVLSITSLSDTYIKPVLIGITFFSIIISSFFSLKKIKNKGAINGLIIGIGFLFILFIISFIINKGISFDMYSYMTMFFGILSGMIGGILGVNIK